MNYYNCIYLVVNVKNNKKYVGQAIDFKARVSKHFSASFKDEMRHDYNVPFHRALRKYGKDAFEWFILKSDVNGSCALDILEQYYIKKYNTLCKNGKGYNVSEGGSFGNPFAGKTDEEIENISKKRSETVIKNGSFSGENNPMYGKHHTEESIKKMIENKKPKQWNEEERKIISERVSGKKHPRAKKIKQYDLDGNLIKVWDYIKQAKKECGYNSDGISKCCKHEARTANGFIWLYYDEELTDEMLKYCKQGNRKPIKQFSKDIKFIREWDGIIDASKTLNICSNTIMMCCKGKAKTAGGFIWRYVEE